MNFKVNITDFLQRQPKAVVAGLGILLLAGVIVAQDMTGWKLSFSVIYLLPICYFAWFFSRSMGILAALMSAAASLAITLAKRPYPNSAFAYWNALLHLALFLALVHIMRELRELYLKERGQSRKDSLTDLANRRAFFETLSAEAERAKRHGLTTTVAYLDADGFKQVNDSFDHETGDQLLVAVADVMRKNLRNIDSVARLGGDEFCVLMPHTNCTAASLVLKKIHGLLNAEMKVHGWPVTFSIGAVTYLHPLDSTHEMIREADQAMYSAKAAGKNRIVQTTRPA